MNVADFILAMRAVEGGRIPYFYLDTNGYVTICTGLLVATENDAAKLDMQPSDCIVRDWQAVKMSKPAMLAEHYAHLTTSRLSEPAMDRLENVAISVRLAVVRKRFPAFATWPSPVQLAVFDMVYSLGLEGFIEYPRLVHALGECDWKTCAAECHRRGVSDDRNKLTADRFLAAAAQESK